MIEIGKQFPNLVTIDEAVMIAFMTPGWRLPTDQEYIDHYESLKFCWDQSDIAQSNPNIRNGYLKLVRDIEYG
jgi:hypothetical protein